MAGRLPVLSIGQGAEGLKCFCFYCLVTVSPLGTIPDIHVGLSPIRSSSDQSGCELFTHLHLHQRILERDGALVHQSRQILVERVHAFLLAGL